MKMKKLLALSLTLVLTIALSACGGAKPASAQNENGIVLFQLAPSTDGAAEFLKTHAETASSYDNDVCYNVTPRSISEQYGLQVFKFDQSCASYLLYEGEPYLLGAHLGGMGVSSFAVADLDQNGANELYFTYSWGSGLHRSQVGYFDTMKKELILFDYSCPDKEMLLVAENGALALYDANVEVESFVDITLQKGEKKLAEIVPDSGKIRLRAVQESAL